MSHFDRRLAAVTAGAIAESQVRIAAVLSEKLDAAFLQQPVSPEDLARTRFFPSRIGRHE